MPMGPKIFVRIIESNYREETLLIGLKNKQSTLYNSNAHGTKILVRIMESSNYRE